MSAPNPMKIVVIGGGGLSGAKVVTMRLARGHEVVATSPPQFDLPQQEIE